MPTGYTAMIEEDGNTNAREFVAQCMRAFMPFIHQREESMSSPPRLPDESWSGESEYRRKSVAEAKARLADVQGWTQAKARVEHEKYVEEAFRINDEATKEYDRARGLYGAVLNKLGQWEPHEEAAGLKKFCIDQIEMCMPKSLYLMEIANFDTWLQEEQKSAQNSLDFYEQQAAEERERHAGHRRLAQIFLDEIERVPE